MQATIEQSGNDYIIHLSHSIDGIYGASVYLNDFNARVSDGGKTVKIGIEGDALTQYENIVDTLQSRLGFSVELALSAKGLVLDAERERQNFLEFSEKARQIRNNNYDVDDFNNFKRHVSTLKIKLKLFQLLAAYHLSFAQNACNFSVPGSGKTITVYGAYQYLRHLETDKRVDRLVVVGPLSCFRAWRKDYKKAFGKKPRCLKIYGGSKQDINKHLNSTVVSHDIILVSYGSLHSYLGALMNFMDIHKSMLVLDEAHKIKKIKDGLWSSTALKLAPCAKARVILTGTPAPNGYQDVYNLYKFIWPAKDIIRYSPLQLSYMSKHSDDNRIEDLCNKIEPFFIRITKKQLHLPEYTLNPPTSVPMGPIQQAIHDNLFNRVPGLEHDAKTNRAIYQSKLIRLRQVASNPSLLNAPLKSYYEDMEGDYINEFNLVDDCLSLSPDIQQKIKDYHKLETPSKFKEALRVCKELISRGEKAIIWCEFVGNIQGLSEYFHDNKIKHERLYGAVMQTDRDKIIDAFHEDDGLSILIANPHVAGESISLHEACHNAIYLEQGFNAATYMQSKDRIHRLGLPADTKTNYYFLHSHNTLDEEIYTRVMIKEAKMLQIVESRDIPLLVNNEDYMEDTEDDLKALIRHYYEITG